MQHSISLHAISHQEAGNIGVTRVRDAEARHWVQSDTDPPRSQYLKQSTENTEFFLVSYPSTHGCLLLSQLSQKGLHQDIFTVCSFFYCHDLDLYRKVSLISCQSVVLQYSRVVIKTEWALQSSQLIWVWSTGHWSRFNNPAKMSLEIWRSASETTQQVKTRAARPETWALSLGITGWKERTHSSKLPSALCAFALSHRHIPSQISKCDYKNKSLLLILWLRIQQDKTGILKMAVSVG